MALDITPGWELVCPSNPVEARPREDNLWMVVSGVLVISMNAAFGLLESGCVRRQNSVNIMMKNICDMTVGGFAWWAFGYAIAFCLEDPSDCAKDKFLVKVSDESFWFFQWTFAATASTIDSGAMAERVAFVPYVILSVTTAGVIYPVAVWWHWGGGYLSKFDPPFQDFAGGAVVHMLGGFSALVAITIIGPRIGRFSDYRPSTNGLAQLLLRRSTNGDYYMTPFGSAPIQPVTDPISLIWGTFFLWFGWYGFNPGGAVDVEGKGTYVIGHIVMNTTMGALGGACCAFTLMLTMPRHRILADGLCVGTLAGLVAVTAGCKWYGNGVAFLIGVMGNLMAVAVKRVLEFFLLDDVVSAIPVHLGGGFIGTIAIGFFAEPWYCTEAMGDSGPVGVFFAEGSEQLERAWNQVAVQFYGCFVIAAWAMAATCVVLVSINQVPLLRLRLPREHEIEGADVEEHKMGHDDLGFRRAVEELVASAAKTTAGSDNLYRSFQHASRQLAILKIMPSLPKSARPAFNKQASDVSITVSVVSVEGVECPAKGHFSWLPSTQGISVAVELVSAVEEGTLKVHHKYFAPRVTTVAEKEPFTFNNLFLFDNFFVPHGVEDFTFLLFTVFINGSKSLEGHLRIMEALQDETDQDVVGERGMSLHEPKGGLEVDGAKLHVVIRCPKRSRLGTMRISRMTASKQAAATLESKERQSSLSSSGSAPSSGIHETLYDDIVKGRWTPAEPIVRGRRASTGTRDTIRTTTTIAPKAAPRLSPRRTGDVSLRLELLERQVNSMFAEREDIMRELKANRQEMQAASNRISASS